MHSLYHHLFFSLIYHDILSIYILICLFSAWLFLEWDFLVDYRFSRQSIRAITLIVRGSIPAIAMLENLYFGITPRRISITSPLENQVFSGGGNYLKWEFSSFNPLGIVLMEHLIGFMMPLCIGTMWFLAVNLMKNVALNSSTHFTNKNQSLLWPPFSLGLYALIFCLFFDTIECIIASTCLFQESRRSSCNIVWTISYLAFGILYSLSRITWSNCFLQLIIFSTFLASNL